MNRYQLLSLLALVGLVIVLPVYALAEPERMEDAQVALRLTYVREGAAMYVENCALCHGASGEGIGAVPGLDNDGLRTADYDFLYKTIARGRYDTTMIGWHSEEGGIFNDYQIDELVALIRYVNWSQVGELAAREGLIPPTLPVPELDEAFLAEIAALGPEASQWAKGIHVYAKNCTVCHGVNGEGSSLAVALNTPELRTKAADELTRTISEGVSGTAMVGWNEALSADDIAALVAFLQNWDVIADQGLAMTPPEPIRIDLDNPEEVLALGERIFSTTCSVCHGENGSGGTGPALNSLQVLTSKSDAQIESTISSGGQRPNSTMPVFGDRLTTVEIGALVDYIRNWEDTATWVENPRGTQQGGGPPWLRATPDTNNPVAPGAAGGATGGQGGGPTGGGGPAGGGGPPWRQNNSGATTAAPAQTAPASLYSGEVVANEGNSLTFLDSTGNLVDAMLGPPWFWSENGILLAAGDQIELEGFQSADHLEVNWLANLSSDERIELRTADGLPVWGG